MPGRDFKYCVRNGASRLWITCGEAAMLSFPTSPPRMAGLHPVRVPYGLAQGEISSLKWTDVDRDAGAIRLRPEAAKIGRGRIVMFEGDLAELIDRRWESRLFEKDGNVRVTARVFHRDGNPVGDFKKAWATACRAAGVAGKLFHDLRRTAARNMVRAGVSERVAMAVTGHVTRSMFDRYNIVSEEDLRMADQKTTMYADTLPTRHTRS